jgi:hypothetical protein
MTDNVRYPDSTFKAKYPYNQAIRTRSGHEIDINDTPDNESLKIAHTKGTFVEINKDGRWTQTVVEKAYLYFKDGLTETVDGHKDVVIGGALNLNIYNSTNENVSGDKYLGVGGQFITAADGPIFTQTNDDKYETVGGDNTASVDGDDHKSIGGDAVTRVGGTKADIVNTAWSVTSGGSIEMINEDGLFRIKCKNFIIEAETISLITPTGIVNLAINADIIAAGKISLSAPEIHLNDLV